MPQCGICQFFLTTLFFYLAIHLTLTVQMAKILLFPTYPEVAQLPIPAIYLFAWKCVQIM